MKGATPPAMMETIVEGTNTNKMSRLEQNENSNGIDGFGGWYWGSRMENVDVRRPPSSSSYSESARSTFSVCVGRKERSNLDSRAAVSAISRQSRARRRRRRR